VYRSAVLVVTSGLSDPPVSIDSGQPLDVVVDEVATIAGCCAS
jgi:hypothetical protein